MRERNILKWARMIKPSSRVSQGFAASWFTPPEGPPRRPLTSYEARKGVAQELSKLMVEPPRAWSSPLISQYKDEYGRPRGTMNLEVACNAPPDSDLRVIAQAYMGSSESGYSIVYWSSTSEVVWHSDSLMQFGDFSICKTDQSWKITYPGLPAAASGDVLAVCGMSPEKWSYECWLSRSSIFQYGGIVFESGWTKWGDIAASLSKRERTSIMQNSKLSRPGPSYWKTAFLVLFPDWAQEAYWDLIDTQRACGIIAAASKIAIQVHLDKPSGGVRPLTMLEESFKAIEGPIARRKTRARRTWPDGTVYFPFNLAGEVAKRATSEVLNTDALVCEDAIRYKKDFCVPLQIMRNIIM